MNQRSLFSIVCIGCFFFYALSGCSSDLANGNGYEGYDCNSDGTCNYSNLVCCESDGDYYWKCVPSSQCNSWSGLTTDSDSDSLVPSDEDIVEAEESTDNNTTDDKYELNWVPIPSGSFLNTNSESVEVQAFDMMMYEVTGLQYTKYLNNQRGNSCWGQYCVSSSKSNFPLIYNPDKPNNTGMWGSWSVHEGHAQHPIYLVTWYGAKAFCADMGGRLPTEAEWEYAARANTTTQYYCGGNEACIYDIACLNRTDKACCDVGFLDPNDFGLYDMLGNVSEWVDSCFTDPWELVDEYKDHCITRGGSYWPGDELEVTYRDDERAIIGALELGFRCVRDVEEVE